VEIQSPVLNIEKYEEAETEINIVTTQRGNETRASRSEQIQQLLRTEHLNTEERKTLEQICQEYADVFHLGGEPLTCTKVVNHRITTRTNTAPVNVRPYRLSEKHKREINKKIQQMLEDDIIQPSASQWNALLLVVPKKAQKATTTK